MTTFEKIGAQCSRHTFNEIRFGSGSAVSSHFIPLIVRSAPCVPGAWESLPRMCFFERGKFVNFFLSMAFSGHGTFKAGRFLSMEYSDYGKR